MMRIGRIPAVRSFAMQLLSPDEPSLLILVNGSDENVRFHLPNDIEWEMIWSSAEIAGEYPGQGTSDRDSWPSSMRKRRTSLPGDCATICSVINTMYWQMDENADSLQLRRRRVVRGRSDPVDAAGSEHQRDEADFDGLTRSGRRNESAHTSIRKRPIRNVR